MPCLRHNAVVVVVVVVVVVGRERMERVLFSGSNIDDRKRKVNEIKL